MSQFAPQNFLKLSVGVRARVAIFVSGSGTNAEKILQFWQNNRDKSCFEPVCIVTDRPEKCRARDLAKKYNLALVAEDIVEFYKMRGLSTTGLVSEAGRRVRQEWTLTLYEKLKRFSIDFGIFAGFVPLTNITDFIPCLNVHPGDLTYCDEKGIRLLVGLHTLPIHLAFTAGLEYLRSSVIVASAYAANGAGMDEGIILGISPAVQFDYLGKDRGYWEEAYKSRAEVKPPGGWQDEYQQFLEANQEKLKINGDWVVFPQVVNDFAAGKFGFIQEKLFYLLGNRWLPTAVVEYSLDEKEVHFRSQD